MAPFSFSKFYFHHWKKAGYTHHCLPTSLTNHPLFPLSSYTAATIGYFCYGDAPDSPVHIFFHLLCILGCHLCVLCCSCWRRMSSHCCGPSAPSLLSVHAWLSNPWLCDVSVVAQCNPRHCSGAPQYGCCSTICLFIDMSIHTECSQFQTRQFHLLCQVIHMNAF